MKNGAEKVGEMLGDMAVRTVARFGCLLFMLSTQLAVMMCQEPIHPASAANRLDEPFVFNCPEGQGIYHVKSNFFRRMNDRIWEFKCRDFPFKNETEVMCDPPTRVMANRLDGPLTYVACNSKQVGLSITTKSSFQRNKVFFHVECPKTGAWAGVMSAHNNEREDRQWNLKCCSHDRFCRHDCYMAGPLNEYQGMLNFTLTVDKEFVVGFFSMHDNRREDRRWTFEVCKIEPCGM